MHAKPVVIVVGVALFLAALPIQAHHSFSAEFDVNRPVKLQGTLQKWEMVNPHSWFHLDVKDDRGNIVQWKVEGGSPNQLIRMGVTKDTVPVGTELIVEGYQAKDGTSKAVGRNFLLPNGTRLFMGGSAPGASGDK
jgi:hypothetical protein